MPRLLRVTMAFQYQTITAGIVVDERNIVIKTAPFYKMWMLGKPYDVAVTQNSKVTEVVDCGGC